MKTEVKPSSENEVVLSVTVPADVVGKRYERTLTRLQRESSLPGFRKGHVPRQVVLQRFGAEYVRGEALQEALPEWYDAALGEADVDAVSMPELDLGDYKEDAEFSFSATVQVRPTPVLGEYLGIEVPRRVAEITDEQVDAQLAMLQERLASLKPVEDRPIAHGDFVLMDLEGKGADGELIEGAQAADYMTEVGRGNLIPGFEDALVGAGHGEERVFDVTFPDDYQAEELQGKPATFKVNVKEIKEKTVPDLDDAFAADVSEFETMEELRADVRTRLEAAAEAGVQREYRAKAVDVAVANATVTVPPAMIEREAHRLYHELAESVVERGLTMDVYLGVLEKTAEQVEEELQPQAELIIKRRLVLEAIVAAEHLEVTDDDITEVVKRDAESLGRDYLQLLADLRESGRQEAIRDELLVAKAVDLVAEKAVPVEVTEADEEAEAEAEATSADEVELNAEIDAEIDAEKAAAQADDGAAAES